MKKYIELNRQKEFKDTIVRGLMETLIDVEEGFLQEFLGTQMRDPEEVEEYRKIIEDLREKLRGL